MHIHVGLSQQLSDSEVTVMKAELYRTILCTCRETLLQEFPRCIAALPRRNRLNDEHFEQMLLLKANPK